MNRFAVLCVSAVLTFVCGCASGVTIGVMLGANPDGVRDTANPCVDGVTNCRAPGPTVLACSDPTPASLSGLQTGTPYSENARTKFSGSSAATATLTVVTDSGTDATANGWAISSAGAGNNLTNGGSNLGSGSLHVRGTIAGPHSVDCPTRNWSYVAPPGADLTPPTFVTGISADSVGSLSVTLSVDSPMDPGDAVAQSGLSAIKFYRNGAFVDSLSIGAGLTCGFALTHIGTGAGSATQGSDPNGGQWSIASTAGYGVETATADSYNGIFCPVAGSSVYVIDRVDSIPNVKTYNKSHSDIRNVGTAGTEAHYDCVIIRQGSVYSMQRTKRASNGSTNASTGQVALAGAPPYYRRTGIVGTSGGCDYSTNGGPWIPVFSADAITLNSSKIAGVGGSATSTGADSGSITVPYGSVAVQTAGRVSKTLTVPAGTATFTATSVDVAMNEQTALAGVSATPTVPSVTKIDWHPGYWLSTWRDSSHFTNQSVRFAEYDQMASNTHLKGFHYVVPWSQLEGATHGDYTAGKALIHAEIDHIKAFASPKRLMLQIMQEPNYSFCTSQACQQAYFPAYFVAAGCTSTAADSTGGLITRDVSWNPTCRQYLLDMIAAYGAEFNSEPYFEAFAYPYESIVQASGQCCGYSTAAYDTGIRAIGAGMRAAFPNKNVFMTHNWYTGDQAQFSAMLAYMNSIGVGWGPGDTLTGLYQTIDKLTVGNVGGHDYRGEAFLIWRVEATELGFANCYTPSDGCGYTASDLYTYINGTIQAQYYILDRNIYIGQNTSRWFSCGSGADYPNTSAFHNSCGGPAAGGLLNLVNTDALGHASCPTSYDHLFGDGSAGSGCN